MRIHLDHSARADDEGHSHSTWAAITNMLQSRRPLRWQNLRQVPILNSTLEFHSTKFAAPSGDRGQKRVRCRTVSDRRSRRSIFCTWDTLPSSSIILFTAPLHRSSAPEVGRGSFPVPAALSSHNTVSSSHLLHISHGGIALMSDHAG